MTGHQLQQWFLFCTLLLACCLLVLLMSTTALRNQRAGRIQAWYELITRSRQARLFRLLLAIQWLLIGLPVLGGLLVIGMFFNLMPIWLL